MMATLARPGWWRYRERRLAPLLCGHVGQGAHRRDRRGGEQDALLERMGEGASEQVGSERCLTACAERAGLPDRGVFVWCAP